MRFLPFPPRRRFLQYLALSAGLGLAPKLPADESLTDRACRSVHLGYPGPASTAFHGAVRPRKSAIGTYFAVCGWNTGYFGMQELGNGKKVLLFSVWDPGQQNDPNGVPLENRVALVEKHNSTRVGRFGNEGTGGQAFYDFEWKLDSTYRFAVAARPAGERTEFPGYFQAPDDGKWIKVVAFSRVGGWQPLRGFYSFVEDFRRDGVSAKQARRADFGDVWLRPEKGEWTPIDRARFTADSNRSKNIEATPIDDRFFSLATGGDTPDGAAGLNGEMRLSEGKTARVAPRDLEEVR